MEAAEKDPRVQELFGKLGGIAPNFHEVSAEKLRPFLSELAWAYYSAYKAILIHSVLRLQLLRAGLNMPDIIDTAGVISVVSVALPERAVKLQENGSESLPFMVQELEDKILESLGEMLSTTAFDEQALKQAAAIMTAAEKLVSETEKRAQDAVAAKGVKA